MKNQECYDKNGKFLGWFSRSMAVAVFVFAKDKDGDWCVLGSERGSEPLIIKVIGIQCAVILIMTRLPRVQPAVS